MKSSSSTSSILRLNEQGIGATQSPLRRSNSSVTLLHQKKLPSYGAERFYILSEMQLNSVPPTFLNPAEHPVDDNMTAETVDSQSQDAMVSELPLQPFSILYLTWKGEIYANMDSDEAINRFSDETILPAVRKIQGNASIRRPSQTPSHWSDDDDDESQNNDQIRSSSLEESHKKAKAVASTRLYLVVEQIPATCLADEEADAHFSKLERYATALARSVSTHAELRSLVQGIAVGVSNLERAAPGLEACMNALLVGSQDRRRHAKEEEGKKSLIGMIAESYETLVGPGDNYHSHSHEGHHGKEAVPLLRQCLVTVEWSAAGDLTTFAERAHKVWREQHGLPAEQPTPVIRKKAIPRRQTNVNPRPDMTDILYDFVVVSILLLYFYFHFRHDAMDMLQQVARRWKVDEAGPE